MQNNLKLKVISQRGKVQEREMKTAAVIKTI